MTGPPTVGWGEVTGALAPGARVFVGGCAAEPGGLAGALAADPMPRLLFTGVPIPGVNAIDWSALSPGGAMETPFVTPELRDGFAAGRVRHLPLHYTSMAARLAAPGHVDAAVIRVCPPRDGSVSLGLAADFAPHAIAGGARLFGAVDPAMPEPPDAPRWPVDRFEAFVEEETPLPTLDTAPADDAVARIGSHVAALVPDGGALQLGLGKVQAAVLGALAGRRGLRFHGGMISDAVMPLVEDGTFSRVTTGVAIGSPTLYDWAGERPGIAFREVGHTHAAATLAAIPRFISVNSVIALDLFGQAVADMLGPRQVSGHGGLVDFVRGAALSEGGRSVLACASTAGRSGASRIVPRLTEGTVTVARGDVDTVVTEHGVAHIGNMDADARADALIAIAAPRHRDTLANEWAAMRSRL